MTGSLPTTMPERVVDPGAGPTTAPDGRAGAHPVPRWRRLLRPSRTQAAALPQSPPVATSELALDVAPNDPLHAFCQQAGGAVDVEGLDLDSAALRQLRAAGAKLVVPLVTQGELIGLLSLGSRLSERDYSGDDRRLLDTCRVRRARRTGRAAGPGARSRARRPGTHRAGAARRPADPAAVPAQARPRPAELAHRRLLPAGPHRWRGLLRLHRAARRAGVHRRGRRHRHGVPAALVMASTHSILRAGAARMISPGKVLERANDVLEPATGEITYANAGHDLPYVRTRTGVRELRATGMPLGLMAGMSYERLDEAITIHDDESAALAAVGVR